MADSTSPIPQIAEGQDYKEVTANGNFDAASPAMLYGRDDENCSGLDFAYLGGRYNSTSIASGTVTVGASTTTYIVADKSTGAVSSSTSTTNWNATGSYERLYKVVSGASSVTSYEDHRQAIGSGSGGSVSAGSVSFDQPSPPLANSAGTDVQAVLEDFDAAITSAKTKVVQVACSDESTALTTGTNKVKFRMPFALEVTAVRASLSTPQTSGSVLTVDINEAGSTILSTKLTFDNTESTTTTATTPAVVSDTSLADDAEISIDIDQVGDGTAKGLKVTLIGY